MNFCVIRSGRGFVAPSRVTPSGVLSLSVIDSLPVLRCYARTLHVFKYGPRAAQVIKDALAKALVSYFPLAGRLESSGAGQLLQIACSGEGVWFVEASANCELASVDYFDDVLSIPYDELLPEDHPPQTDEARRPLVLMQVTQFACDGFVIGLSFCHSLCDGLGAAQFLRAVGELARGFDHPNVSPVWHRDFLRLLEQQKGETFASELHPKRPLPSPPLLPQPTYRLEQANIDIPLDHINQLKRKFHESTGRTCSSFEVIAATLLKHRTQAAISNAQVVKLVFFANCRQLVEPALPKGFYGNCFFPVSVTASSETLSESDNAHEAVKMIQEAKARLPVEFAKWAKGEAEEDPFAPPLGYTTLFISEWGRLGFNEVDYGWGPPIHVVPIQGSPIIPVGIVASLPSPKKGVRLMTWCVDGPHLRTFLSQMATHLQ
ncbi:acyl transferase 4 [Diospyros lotus]|uniref:acyl transferase 4 n=1 Tax=Diospyros lotus TaxID=55363 RepID=UPI00225852A1|nr:acyl transferase 4 [Diospyros lotus]